MPGGLVAAGRFGFFQRNDQRAAGFVRADREVIVAREDAPQVFLDADHSSRQTASDHDELGQAGERST